MPSPRESGPSRPDASGGRPREGMVLALCLVGLVVAAFAMPAFSGPTSAGESGDPETVPEPSDAAANDGGQVKPDEGNGDDGGDGPGGRTAGGDWVVLDGDGPPPEGCVVALEGQQVPGARVVVHAWSDGEPIRGVGVWFNDRFVGETDGGGRVTGRVPYRTELRVTVSPPDGASCRFARVAGSDAMQSAAGGVTGASLAGSWSLPAALPADESANETYAVDGAVNLRVRGAAYPDERVTVVAAVEGVPMREAMVRVDGERVGHTDERGRYEIRVPADGSETVSVGVTRGDFSGETEVQVRLLRLAVEPSTPFPLPGSPATIRATFGDGRPANATVLIDGKRVGSTGADGEFAYPLASDPGSTVTVRARDQVATTTLWPAYATTVVGTALVGVLLVGSHATAYRRGGRRWLGRTAAVWLLVTLAVAGSVAAGRNGGLAVLGLFALAGTALVARRRRGQVGTGARSVGALLAALARWVPAGALRAARALKRAASRAQRALAAVRDRLAALPRSVSELAARLGARLRRLPRRAGLAVARRWNARVFAIVALALGLVALAAAVGGTTGFAAALGLLALAGVVAALRGGRPTGNDTSTGRDRADSRLASARTAGRPDAEPSLRELWATFARRVAPNGWRRRAPGEIARAATERGYPRDAVEELTRVFREVEYDDRPLSPARRARASEAFAALEATHLDEEGEGT